MAPRKQNCSKRPQVGITHTHKALLCADSVYSYGENWLTCANLHMRRFAHVSKSNFAMLSDKSYVP